MILLDMAASHHAASPTDNAHVKVFHKTLAFFCTLVEKVCVFSSMDNFPQLSNIIEQENDFLFDGEEFPIGNCRHKANKCFGQLKLWYNNYNQPYI